MPAPLTALVGAAAILLATAASADDPTEGDGGGKQSIRSNVRTTSRRRRTRDGVQLTTNANPNRARSYDPYRHHTAGEDKSQYNVHDQEGRKNGAPESSSAAVPDLSDLLDEGDVVGDVSWMLDFAIVGNAKCGTTFLAHYINRGSDRTSMPNTEVCKLSHDAPGELVELLYDNRLKAEKREEERRAAESAESAGERMSQNEPQPPPHQEQDHEQEQQQHQQQQGQQGPAHHPTRHGLKCPKELGTEHALRNYATYFPETDFIVTLRHPVLWFQSFYNYRFGNKPLDEPPPPRPSELVGPCLDDGSPYLCGRRCASLTYKENVCTDRAKFHHQLARFGKTPMADPDELRLLRGNGMEVVPVRGRVFLMELGQLIPGTESSRSLPGDLSDFLRLGGGGEGQKATLPDIVAKKHHPVTEVPPYDIEICDDEYAAIRALLVETGADAAGWIRNYFLESADVVVSSREEFLDMIEDWKLDPCEDRVEMRRVLEVQRTFEM